MILNKLIDKAIEAAKQSAMQMYGYDLSELKGILHDEAAKGRDRGKEPNQHLLPAGKPRKGVTFERTENNNRQSERSSSQSGIEEKLTAIRAYAARQTSSDISELAGWSGTGKTAKPLPKRDTSAQRGSAKGHSPAGQIYSRRDIRIQSPANEAAASPDSRYARAGNKGMDMDMDRNKIKKKKTKTTPSAARSKKSSMTGSGAVPAPNSAAGSKKVPAHDPNVKGLHKRLDRLESLMHLSLSSDDDLSYAAHPAFHELLHKGVPKRLISGWFHAISEQGIHPTEQGDLFGTKLFHMICESITGSKAASPKQLLFFAGRSGSGKTKLIMKLSQHVPFTEGKKVAVGSLEPVKESRGDHYYTILAPFCRDHDIPYYPLKGKEKLDALQEEWKQFDHILLDTPSLEAVDDQSLKQLMNIKRELGSQRKTETHYLVNTSVNGVAFNDPLAAQVEADHLALTHIDKSNKWGKTIPLLNQTDRRLRFISTGESVSGDLVFFDPERFANRLLN